MRTSALSRLLSPEARLLLLIAQPDPPVHALPAALLSSPPNWPHLLWLAHRERAIPVLWDGLRTLPEKLVPADFASQLSRAAQVTRFRMQHLEQRLEDALDTLAADGIAAVLLKGAAHAATIYGSFADRPMGDVDLLVRPEHAQRAWLLLQETGWICKNKPGLAEFYAAHHHLPPLDDARGTGLGLEIHTGITPLAALGLTGQQVWEHATSHEWKGKRVYVPSPAHQLLHLAIHFAWSHALNTTGWCTFRDLHWLMRRSTIGWDQLLDLAQHTNARTCCYWTLRLARSLSALPAPDLILAALRPQRSRMMLDLLERHFASSLFAINQARCPSTRLTDFLWATAVSSGSSSDATALVARGEEWRERNGDGGAQPAWKRLNTQLRRVRDWSRYLSAVMIPGWGGRGERMGLTQRRGGRGERMGAL